MRRLQITIMIEIDEIGKVKLTNMSFVYKGCKDASIFEGEIMGDEAPITTEVVPPSMRLTTVASQQSLLALAKLGFTEEESKAICETIGEKRIIDVSHWIAQKNGVASPKRLAEKLFKLA